MNALITIFAKYKDLVKKNYILESPDHAYFEMMHNLFTF